MERIALASQAIEAGHREEYIVIYKDSSINCTPQIGRSTLLWHFFSFRQLIRSNQLIHFVHTFRSNYHPSTIILLASQSRTHWLNVAIFPMDINWFHAVAPAQLFFYHTSSSWQLPTPANASAETKWRKSLYPEWLPRYYWTPQLHSTCASHHTTFTILCRSKYLYFSLSIPPFPPSSHWYRYPSPATISLLLTVVQTPSYWIATK